MKIVSLLKHDVNIINAHGEIITIKPTGVICDCRTREEVLPELSEEGLTIVRQCYGEINNLPEPQEGVLYLVSTLTMQAALAQGRRDFCAPNSGPTAVRYTQDDAPRPEMVGQVRYVRTLQMF